MAQFSESCKNMGIVYLIIMILPRKTSNNNHAQLHKGTYLGGKTELDQYPAILTSTFIYKAYVLINAKAS